MARHRQIQDYAVYQPQPQPLYKDIDWWQAAKVGAIAGAPVVGGVSLYGRGLAEQGVPKGNTLNALRREIQNKTYGSITGTMVQGLKSYGKGTKEGAGSAWQSFKDAFRGVGGKSLQETRIKFRPKRFMSKIDRLVQLNVKLDGEIQFATLRVKDWPHAIQEGIRKAPMWQKEGKMAVSIGMPAAPGYRTNVNINRYGSAEGVSYKLPHSARRTVFREDIGYVGDPKKRYYAHMKQGHFASAGEPIQFADKDRSDYFVPVAAGAGVVGTGAAGYGLYRKGVGMPGRPPSERTRVITNRKGVQRDPGYFIKTRELAPAKRGVLGNIVVGAQQVGHEATIAPSLLSHPMARQAIAHDIRSGLSSRLARIASKIKP